MEEPQLHWYAVKVFYNKVFELEASLEAQGYATFIAVDKVILKGEAHLLARKRIASLKAEGMADRRYEEEGAQILQRVPMVSSLLFVRSDSEEIKSIDSFLKNFGGQAKGFVYKSAQEDGRYDYAAIPDKQMETFRLVTSRGSEGLEFFSADDISRFKTGCKVRVTEGPFKGAEGYIKRIRRDRRLLVNVEGIVAVVTAFIDPAFLEILPN